MLCPLRKFFCDDIAEVPELQIPVQDALGAFAHQKSYFSKIDKFSTELKEDDALQLRGHRASKNPLGSKVLEAQDCLGEFSHVPSPTVVMEAVFFCYSRDISTYLIQAP